ncbi:MAG: hypothetical protein ABFE07_28600 [Armatimonadia bacterium]
MPKFRKKPVVIEALPVSAVVRGTELPSWAAAALECGEVRVEGDGLWVSTMEGKMRGESSAWLIRGVKGELYCCDAEIFARTYEAVGESPADISAPCNQVMEKLRVAIDNWDPGRSADVAGPADLGSAGL